MELNSFVFPAPTLDWKPSDLREYLFFIPMNNPQQGVGNPSMQKHLVPRDGVRPSTIVPKGNDSFRLRVLGDNDELPNYPPSSQQNNLTLAPEPLPDERQMSDYGVGPL